MARSNNTSAGEAIQEPGLDWLPLELAPLHYVIDYAASAQDWADQLRKLVELGAELAGGVPPPPPQADDRPPRAEFRFESLADSGRKMAWIQFFGKTLVFDAEKCMACLRPTSVRAPFEVFIYGPPDEFLRDEEWGNFAERASEAANWFRSVAQFVISRMHQTFESSIRAGASRIMARKNTVLAPFDIVHLDQWNFFKLDDPKCPQPDARKWIDPLYCDFHVPSSRGSSSATGPHGEKAIFDPRRAGRGGASFVYRQERSRATVCGLPFPQHAAIACPFATWDAQRDAEGVSVNVSRFFRAGLPQLPTFGAYPNRRPRTMGKAGPAIKLRNCGGYHSRRHEFAADAAGTEQK